MKRRLVRKQPLTGALLEFALDAIGGGMREPADDDFNGMAKKLREGLPFDDYELHLMLDIVLLHIRLAALAAERLERSTP